MEGWPSLELVSGALHGAYTLVVDVETTGLSVPGNDRICGVALRGNGQAFYLPVRHAGGFNYSPEGVFGLTRDLLAASPWSLYWNAGFDIAMLRKEGILVDPRRILDGMVAAHLSDENQHRYNLEMQAQKVLGVEAADDKSAMMRHLTDSGLTKGDLWRLPAEQVAPYGMADVTLTEDVSRHYATDLEVQGLKQLWFDLGPYIGVMSDMHRKGICVNPDEIAKARVTMRRESMQLAIELVEELGPRAISVNSPKVMCSVFNLPDAQRATMERAVEGGHPLSEQIGKVLAIKRNAKTVSSFLDPYGDKAHDHPDGPALHPHFNLIGTISGRLSCSDPNLQAVPDFSSVVKRCFVARPGMVFLSMDYSQAELRLAAHYTRDERMVHLLTTGADLHQATADRCCIPRPAAKRINFGSVYGLGAKGLAEKLNIPYPQAKRYMAEWNRAYPSFAPFRQRAQDSASRRGYIKLWTGRRRHYPEGSVDHDYWKAFSNLIQGGVAEVMRVSATRCADEFPEAHQLLHVHDQILFEVPAENAAQLAPRLAEALCDHDFRVPLVVDAKIGQSWGTMEKLECSTNRT